MSLPRVFVLLIACGLGACQQPFVYEASEFNRNSANFGRPLQDRTSVDICYATRTTTPQDLLATAEAECGKFNKSARYIYSDVLVCPMTTPLRAHFSCDPR